MALEPGRRLGSFELLSLIGAGGMGEVYRAKDTRLDRTVAIKVLPSHLSSSSDFRQRFEREAKAISALNHSHICTLHDVGHHEGIDFLVMEYLEGETLADRLKKGPLPLEHALRYGVEIADALDKAHRQGIVHRDLKPGNVMLTKSGAKLLDFGLAKLKATEAKPTESELSALPTAQKPLTEEGTILGTFQYMAPEQLEGKEADGRTDLWALGCVLYEMASGKGAFTGKSKASLIAAILEREPPPVSSIQPMTPPALDRVVKTCLAKDPDERWQNAHDLMSELRWIAEGGSQAAAAPSVLRPKGRERLAWAIVAALLLAVGTLGLALREARRGAAGAGTVASSIVPPEGASFGPFVYPAISPDGRRLAFVARGEGGKTVLWVRPLAALEARALPDTEGASRPFWSPDSRFLGFFSGGKLRKIDASGGPVETLYDALVGRGGAWGRDGTILFTPSIREPLYRVAATGGVPTPVTQIDSSRRDFSHRWPSFLPDGNHFLYFNLTSRREDTGIYVGSLDSKESRFLSRSVSNAAYAPPGYLLFWREGSLMAQAFDPDRLALAGEALPIAERVAYHDALRWADFSVSPSGVLLYRADTLVSSRLVWLDRGGREIRSIPEAGYYRSPGLSPEGHRIAAIRLDPRTRAGDIWLFEAARGTATRFTLEPGEYYRPTWSADGQQIMFSANRAGLGDLYQKDSSGAGPETLVLATDSYKIPSDCSSDGRLLLYQTLDPETGWDVWALPLFGERKPMPFLKTPFREGGAQFSPSARYAAYESDESGRNEVYVRPFPGPGGAQRVSSEGGTGARWRRDGKELYYVSPDRKLMAVELEEGPTVRIGSVRALWETSLVEYLGEVGIPDYDVSADGQRFLVILPVGKEPESPITLVLNWTAQLKR